MVAFPTETVYGLGANALDRDACQLIYKVKNRPKTSPLIMHIDEARKAFDFITQEPSLLAPFTCLAKAFWPGPLTVVLPTRTNELCEHLSGGTPYLGIRVPNHPVALRLLSSAGCPLAAPSANLFGHISPTHPSHVFDDFATNQLTHVYILDQDENPPHVGLESTVLKLAASGEM